MIRIRRTVGGESKIAIASAKELNLYVPQKRKFEKAEIVRVISNAANRDYERRGVITKGAIVETPLGKARVTSRPGQHGIVNAVLIGEQEAR